MAHPEHYGKVKLLKIGDYNVSETGDIITIPHYMTFIIRNDEELYELDKSTGDFNGVILNVYSKDTRKKLKNPSEYTKKLRVYKAVLGLQYHNR